MMREISKQLGFNVGTGHRTLSLANTKQADIAAGTKEGWIMLTNDEHQSKYTNMLNVFDYWIKNNDMVWYSPFKVKDTSHQARSK